MCRTAPPPAVPLTYWQQGDFHDGTSIHKQVRFTATSGLCRQSTDSGQDRSPHYRVPVACRRRGAGCVFPTAIGATDHVLDQGSTELSVPDRAQPRHRSLPQTSAGAEVFGPRRGRVECGHSGRFAGNLTHQLLDPGTHRRRADRAAQPHPLCVRDVPPARRAAKGHRQGTRRLADPGQLHDS